MKYNSSIRELNLNTGISVYLCTLGTGKMSSFHNGKVYESDTPKWMSDYIQSSQTILPFVQDGKQKQYCRWVFDENNIMVFLDEPSFVVQNTLVKNLILKPYYKEVHIDNSSEIADLNYTISQMKTAEERNRELIKELNDEISSLKEQNSDQALRLKNALSENMELSKKIKNAGTQAGNTFEEEQEHYQKRLSFVIKSLNNIITTGSATGIDLEILSIVTTVTSHRELERSPDLVKSIIAKLIGMDRTGKLTPYQLKRLQDAFKNNSK